MDAHTQVSSEKVALGPLEVDFEGLTVHCPGQAVSLTATEFKILAAMVRHPNRVFSRGHLIEAALGGYFEGYERTVDSHISHLRRKLAAAGPACEDLIQTYHGVGYKLVPPQRRP